MRLVRIAAASALMSLLLVGPTLAGTISDVSVSKADSPDPVLAGSNLTYTITVQNAGPMTAPDVTLFDPLPTGTTFVSFTAPAGWTAMTPAVGGTGTVSANITSLTVAAGAQVFTLVVNVSSATPNGTVITNVASVATLPSFSDPNINNDSSAQQTTVTAPAASLADASMPEPASANPLVTIGFTALLLALLSGVALLAVKRARP
jgi:uncharacterized repeat protein (TIGR01451 family)